VRLSVGRSNNHIYVQLIDDTRYKTLASPSTLEKDLRTELKYSGNIVGVEQVGQLIAERAKKLGLNEVVSDRGG
jgi:large subunit ribosomal protein L18